MTTPPTATPKVSTAPQSPPAATAPAKVAPTIDHANTSGAAQKLADKPKATPTQVAKGPAAPVSASTATTKLVAKPTPYQRPAQPAKAPTATTPRKSAKNGSGAVSAQALQVLQDKARAAQLKAKAK